MNNTELKNLLKTITPTKNELEQMQHTTSSLSEILKNNISGNVKVAELHIGGSFAKGTIIKGRKEVDLVVVISPKSKNKYFYKDLASLSMNYIENTFYHQYYDRLLNQTDDAKIVRNYDRNTLSMTDTNGVDIDFLIKFKKEQLLASTKKDVENFYLERDNQQLKFIEEATKEFTLFKNSVMLIKKLRNDENCHILKSYMIEIIMCYSLKKYLKGNDYVAYLNAFFTGLGDFKNKTRIEVTNDMYSKLGTKNSAYPNDAYQVIDVANKSNNVAMYIKDISPINNFYCKYVNEFANEKQNSKQTSSAITCQSVKNTIKINWKDNGTKEFRIASKIPGFDTYKTDIVENSTEHTMTNLVSHYYRHLSRIVKMYDRHNFNKNIVIECPSIFIDIYDKYMFKTAKVSYQLSKDEINKFDQLKTRIKKLGMKLTFEAL